MASGDSDPSTRTSAEYNRFMCEIALKHFKTHKVEISDAINTPFPFLETLRDRGFITSEMYEETKNSCKSPSTVTKTVYEVLDKIEEKCHLPLLEVLFSKVIMKNYPDLNGVRENFRDEILKKICHQANAGGESAQNPGTQLSLEQGTGANSYQNLSWLFHDLSVDTGVELPNRGILVNSCSVSPVHVREAKPSLHSGGEWEAQARTGYNKAQDVIVIKDDTIPERGNTKEPPGASPSAQKRKAESITSRKSPTSGNKLPKKVRISEGPSGLGAEEQRPGAGSPAVGSAADVAGPVDLGKNPTLQKAKNIRTGQQLGGPVTFRAEVLPVTCGLTKGSLIKRKLERGATRKCIRSEDGNWYTPREFEVRGGYEKSSNWKTSLICRGKTLKELMELGKLHTPPRTVDRNKKMGNSNKCEICQDGGKLFRCATCYRFFHGDCHLPPVDTRRNSWICTFCKIQNSSRSQPRYRESEVLMKQMGPEEKSKCEFLLLKVYYHLENEIFPNIPHENYARKASEYLRKLRMLDRIKKKLIKGNYPQVEDLVWAMDNFFWDSKCTYLHLIKEEFKDDFKEVFAIQETN